LIIDVDNINFVDNPEDLGIILNKIDAELNGLPKNPKQKNNHSFTLSIIGIKTTQIHFQRCYQQNVNSLIKLSVPLFIKLNLFSHR
jgi:hypothetical protein